MTNLPNTIPLETFSSDYDTGKTTGDRIEAKLYVGRIFDSSTADEPIIDILSMPQVWPGEWFYKKWGKLN